MKNLTLVVAMILFSSYVTSQLLEATYDEDRLWWNSPYSPLSDTNSHHYRPSPELAKCFSDHKKVMKCLNKVFRKVPIVGSKSSECCAAIKTLYQDCEKTDFGSFRNPFYNYYVKQHCSTQGGSTPATPVTPSPAAPSPA